MNDPPRDQNNRRYAAVLIAWSLFPFSLSLGEEAAGARVFRNSRIDLDNELVRPYDADQPMGCVGRRIWTSSPQGWGFASDVHYLYFTNAAPVAIEIADKLGQIEPARGDYFPSRVRMSGAQRAFKASASFTFRGDNVNNPLLEPFRPEKRWTCWSSGKREDWYAVDFGRSRPLTGLELWFFDDAPSGECRPPSSFTINYRSDKDWQPVPNVQAQPSSPSKGKNVVSFPSINANSVRLHFRHAGERFYTGLYGLKAISEAADNPSTSPLEITADKFITADDALVVLLRVENKSPSTEDISLSVRFDAKLASPAVASKDISGERGHSPWLLSSAGKIHGLPAYAKLAVAADEAWSKTSDQSGGIALTMSLAPAASSVLRAVATIAPVASEASVVTDRWLASKEPLADHVREYRDWFDHNLAYFDCSDPWLKKMYYHRAYLLRKNLLEPNLGKMQWPAFSEGRWRSSWYPNVISYGAGHQIREARWLREKRYWQGHLATFANNEKPDGVYPSHVRPAGQQGRQYTDWITSTAWDGDLVHPDADFLRSIVDRLADNVRGWQKVYDPDGDGLLRVDSHWWTGMEWQPSFFYFSGYKTGTVNKLEPAERVDIERVDLTAYNFGNAVAVANIYRKLGQREKAAEFDQLAKKIQAAVAAKMWEPKSRFFYSLRASDKKRAAVKEIIGVYPFYFGMFPSGDERLAAWDSIVDPNEFWTPWPVASVSKTCPAYSQDGWPVGGGGTVCMWNGPTWPHANSIVLSAMARTLRDNAGRELPFTADHFWSLFDSLTRAQFRDQDIDRPWTGEFYRGDNAVWKTAERDYFHSTWLDILIADVIGLVPTDSNTLVVHPLVPSGKLSYFLLDGQHYRGHDVTIVWDDPKNPEDHYADNRRGLDIYVDRRLRVSSPTLSPVTASLAAE